MENRTMWFWRGQTPLEGIAASCQRQAIRLWPSHSRQRTIACWSHRRGEAAARAASTCAEVPLTVR